MSKIIQFIDYNIPFVRDSYHAAISSLKTDWYAESPIEVINLSYDMLKTCPKMERVEDETILFLEAGQLQPKHSGWDLKRFKEYLPNGKVVVWSSDLPYYIHNGFRSQFNDSDKVDFVFECTPSMNKYWEYLGVKSVSIPWTISRKLHDELRLLASPHINFYRKTNDFWCLANFSGEYRQKLKDFLLTERYSISIGGNHQDRDLEKTYENALNSYICLGSTSHNRPELNLPGQHTLKGYRDAVAISLDCLLIYDNYPLLNTVWNMGENLPLYDFDDFNSILEIYKYYRDDLVAYQRVIRKQQAWLEDHLLDQTIYKALKENNIL